MLFAEMDTVLKPLRDEVAGLEKRAGVEGAVERAREGSFFPLGIDGEKVDPEEYFADEADHVRRGVRRAYFGVKDVALRKEMIEALRSLDAKHSELLDRDVGEKASEVSKAKGAVRNLPWSTGMIIALVCVGIGYYSKGETGTIVGAVFGLFMGMGYVWNSKGAAETALEQAEANHKDSQRDRRVRNLRPETFNMCEQLSGEEDHEFGGENGRWNVKAFLEKEAA